MTTLTIDSVVTPELSSDNDVAFKAISGQIGGDKARGIVECFVSAIGNKDSVGDVVMPGAFNSSLKRRKELMADYHQNSHRRSAKTPVDGNSAAPRFGE